MSTVPGEVREFLAAIGKTAGAWHSVDVRTVAVRIEGELQNLNTVIRLSPKLLETTTELLANTESLSAMRRRRQTASSIS